MSSRSTRRAASPTTCRTRAAPTTRRARPRPPTGSTSTACMRAAGLAAAMTREPRASPASSCCCRRVRRRLVPLRLLRPRARRSTSCAASAKRNRRLRAGARQPDGLRAVRDDAERFFSFWSLALRPEDGRVVEARQSRVAELRACFGSTDATDATGFHAEVRLVALHLPRRRRVPGARGRFPAGRALSGALPARPGRTAGAVCRRAAHDQHDDQQGRLRGDTAPPGYTQASIATIRLWRSD